MRCKYGGEHRKKSETYQRKTFTYKDQCEAYITIHYKNKKGVLEVVDLCDEHKHDRSDTIYKGLPK